MTLQSQITIRKFNDDFGRETDRPVPPIARYTPTPELEAAYANLEVAYAAKLAEAAKRESRRVKPQKETPKQKYQQRNHAYLDVMRELGPVTCVQMAERFGSTRMAAYDVLRRLLKKGQVTRTRGQKIGDGPAEFYWSVVATTN